MRNSKEKDNLENLKEVRTEDLFSYKIDFQFEELSSIINKLIKSFNYLNKNHSLLKSSFDEFQSKNNVSSLKDEFSEKLNQINVFLNRLLSLHCKIK